MCTLVLANDVPIKNGRFVGTDLDSCKFNLGDISLPYPCIKLLPASSRHVPIDRDKQSRPRIRYSAISRDNGRSILLYPDLPAGVNFHKRIQISRPRRNLTIPRVGGAGWWNFRFGVLNSHAPPPPPLSAPCPSSAPIEVDVCLIFILSIYPTLTSDLALFSDSFSARELSFSSYIHRMLNTQDGTLALILAAHVTRSTTCTTDTVLIISVNCAPQSDRFFHG